MARKNVRADNSIQFDIRTNTVMAQSTTSHNHVKQKVNAVREVVPGKTFDEIVLVLQYYDYNSEKAIQAYLEDGAKEALQQWHFSGSKVQNKKKKPKKGKAEEGGSSSPDVNGTASHNSNNNNTLDENHMVNGNHTKDISDQSSVPASIKHDKPQSVNSKPSPTSNSSLDRRDEVQLKTNKSSMIHHREKHSSSYKQHSGNNSAAAHDAISTSRARTISECSVSSFTGPENFAHKKGGLERTVKDLQRQTASLERLRLTFDGEMEKCPKRIKSVFEDVRTALSNRELQMIIEFEQMKLHSKELFTMRQQKAHELKVKVDRADAMNEHELAELRADVKHFVSERKLDEDLAKTTRFMYDSDFLIAEIKKFGEIVPTKHSYSERRPSTSSVASSGAGHNHHHPGTTNHHNQSSFKHSASSTATTDTTKNGTNNDKDDDSDVELTAQDLEDLQKRLQNSMRISKGPPRNRPKNTEQGSDDRKNNNSQRKNRDRNDKSPRKSDDRPRENRQRSPRKADERSQGSRDQDDKPKNNQQQSNGPHREGSGRGRGRGGYRGRGRGRGGGRSPGKEVSTNGNKSDTSKSAPVTDGKTSGN